MRTWTLAVLAMTLACGARQHPDARVDPPAFRLPRDVRPTAYTVDLTLTPGELTFTGKVEIEVDLAVPTRVI